jgi:tol-pal system protein YbgF
MRRGAGTGELISRSRRNEEDDVSGKCLASSLILVPGLALGLVFASGTSASAQKKEDVLLSALHQIQVQLTELQSEQATLKAAIDALTARSGEEQDSLRKTLADSKVSVERIQQDMSVLSERIDETNARIGSLREDVASLRQTQQPILIPGETTPAAPEGSGPTASAVPPAGGEPPPASTTAAPAVVAAAPSVTDLYNQARIDYTQGRYPLAISGFKEVLELDSRGDLADNAHYWMGESYLAQRQYDPAIQEFDRIIRDYPESNKRPDAYLKKAMTLEEMGRRSEANLMYELVIEQFPKTNQERVARRRLEELMKTTVR